MSAGSDGRDLSCYATRSTANREPRSGSGSGSGGNQSNRIPGNHHHHGSGEGNSGSAASEDLSFDLSLSEIECALQPSASCIVHVYDRRVNLSSFDDGSSQYRLARAWVQDDPYRSQPIELSLDLHSTQLPSLKRNLKRNKTNLKSSSSSRGSPESRSSSERRPRELIGAVNSRVCDRPDALLAETVERSRRQRKRKSQDAHLRNGLACWRLRKYGITHEPPGRQAASKPEGGEGNDIHSDHSNHSDGNWV